MWPKRRRSKQDRSRSDQPADESKGEDPGAEETGGAQPDAFGRESRDPGGRRRYGWRPEPKGGSDPAAPQTAERASDAPEAPAAEPAPTDSTQPDEKPKRGWLARLREGLSRSSGKIGEGIGAALTKRKLDDQALEQLEEVLIAADMGVQTAAKLVQNLARERFNKNVDPEEVRGALAADVERTLAPVARPLQLDAGAKPHVVLVVGVNGSGKTTTIGKLAKQHRDQGRRVHLAAGDTFRAAAVEQLQIWGERTGCPVTARDTGADAAGLAYDALQHAQTEGADLLLIDTAGRLHNKQNLMAELQKVIRVLRKLEPAAPHDVLLVLDATTGQNAVSQVQTFKELVDVTGLAVTKLDGSARGGVLVALAEKFGLPVNAIGVGETADDLRPFDARSFSRALMGLDPAG